MRTRMIHGLLVEQVAQQLSCSQRKVYHMIENKDI